MPWKLTSLVAERMRLVSAVLKGHKPMQQVADDFGVSRKTAGKWLRRFMRFGRRGLRDLSRRPHQSPRRIGGHWRQRVAQLRRSHRRWGPKKLHAWLVRHHGAQGVPAIRTMAGWLKASGRVSSPRRRSGKGPRLLRPGLTVANRPNDVWTVDFKGWFRTGDGTRIEPLTVRDLSSRYLLAVCLLPGLSWERVQAAFVRLFVLYGLPLVMRMDNGAPFGSSGPAGLTRLSAWWTALGIRVEFIVPGHPEQNGAHEQMHRVLKAETAMPPARTKLGQQQRLRRWVRLYNQSRPHEGLGQRVPEDLYRASRRSYVVGKVPGPYPSGLAVRRVRSCGTIKWQGRERFIGEAFVRYQVALKPQSQGEWRIYFGKLLLGVLHANDVGGLRPSAYVRRHRPFVLLKP
jgi:putative transposase